MGQETFRHRFFAAIGTAGIAVAAIDTFAVRSFGAIIFLEPGRDRLLVHRIIGLSRIFIPPVNQMRPVIAAGNDGYFADFERGFHGLIAGGQFCLAYRRAKGRPGFINIFGLRMNQAVMLHPQANAIVDHS